MENTCLFESEITEHSVRAFSEISGDFNPLHNDPSYARQTEFGRPISHGALLVGLVSRVLGMHIPGQRSLIHSMNVQFPKPLYFPAKVKVEGQLKNFNLERNMGKVSVTITDLSRLWPVCEAEVNFSLHAMKENRSETLPKDPETAPARVKHAAGSALRLLVTGATGGVGSVLLPCLSSRYEPVCLTRSIVDLEEPGALEKYLEQNSPEGFYGILHLASAPMPRAFVTDDLELVRRHWRQSVEVPLLFAKWARGSGSTIRRIVLIGSTAGTRYPKPNLGAYSLGKAAMEHLARLLTSDLAVCGATINIVLPTVIPVGLNQGLPERALKALAGKMPTGKTVEPKDVANVVEFLLSEASGQINGTCIAVDGGLAD